MSHRSNAGLLGLFSFGGGPQVAEFRAKPQDARCVVVVEYPPLRSSPPYPFQSFPPYVHQSGQQSLEWLEIFLEILLKLTFFAGILNTYHHGRGLAYTPLNLNYPHFRCENGGSPFERELLIFRKLDPFRPHYSKS